MDAALLARQRDMSAHEEATPGVLLVDKWVILRGLGTARSRLGVTDRQLVVLQALLGLRKGTELRLDDPAGLVVHPSNATLCARLNGMPCSTLRRHLAHLIDAGLIARRDSPNGKRYVRRYRDGNRDVFGFDLSPLVHRASEILACAEAVRNEAEQISRHRHTISLMRRDLAGLIEVGRQADPGSSEWDRLDEVLAASGRTLRRQLTAFDLAEVRTAVELALDAAKTVLESRIPSTSARRIEQHCQSSEEDITVLEAEIQKDRIERHASPSRPEVVGERESVVSLQALKRACPEMLGYSADGIRDWRDLYALANKVSPMMGISRSAWLAAVKTMGPIVASTAVSFILQRFGRIASPGGYLRVRPETV